MTQPRKLGRRVAACVLSVVVATCLVRAWHGNEPTAWAQAPRPLDVIRAELRPRVEELLTLYSQGKVDDMLQRMPVAPAQTRDEFDSLRHDLVAVSTIAGRYTGFDIVRSRTLSDRYYELYVLAYFEKEPVLFEFGFYRPADTWQVQRFKFRTDLGPFLDALLEGNQ
jgi:hypothetical protein